MKKADHQIGMREFEYGYKRKDTTNHEHHHRMIIPTPIASAPDTNPHTETLEKLAPSPLGASLLITDWVLEAVAVHCSPHAYPVGQQFPPRLAAQLYHALAQTPPCAGAVVANEAPVGATTTTPLVPTTVTLAVGTQDPVVWQSLPTLQQPLG